MLIVPFLASKKRWITTCSRFERVLFSKSHLRRNTKDIWKSTKLEDIPFSIIKDNAATFGNFLLQNVNRCIIHGKFPDQLKKAHSSLAFKKENIMIKPTIIRWVGFDTHVTNICNRVTKKLQALARISQFMNIHKCRMTRKVLIASEFGYCPLV